MVAVVAHTEPVSAFNEHSMLTTAVVKIKQLQQQHQQQFEQHHKEQQHKEFSIEDSPSPSSLDERSIVDAMNSSSSSIDENEHDRENEVLDGELQIAEDDIAMTTKQPKGQVVIYESGKPILKVESGTTLEVVKLLYETESSNDNNIIGVRPKLTASEIPCIITLQDSKLDENGYDLITKDKKPSSQPTPIANGYIPNEQNGLVTTRCIDCARESWKTKRYTNVGMNTEISINPLTDVETVHAITSSSGSKPNHQKSYSQNHIPTSDPPKRGRPPLQRNPTYSNIRPKDYVVAAVHGAIPVPVSEMEFHGRRRHRSPGTSPIHLFGPSKIYPPKVDLDSVPYETIRSIHHPPLPHYLRRHSPPTHRMMKIENEHHSPPRRPRSRSPPMRRSGYLKEEPRDYFPRYPEEKPPRGIHHRMSPRYYPYEIPPPAVIAVPAPMHPEAVHHPQEANRNSPEHNSKEIEPPVYVLPEDFNLKMDRFDPNMLASQQPPADLSRDHKLESHNIIKPKKQTEQSSPTESSKSTHEENQPVAEEVSPSEHKLSCKICKQSFPTKSTLYKHLRGHSSDEKPFKCNECGQGFTLSSNLRQHRIIHRGYKPFQCEYCGKKFMRSNVYKQHRRIHTGEQMHKCDLCPSEFLQKYALVKHLKKTHNIETYDN